MSQLALSRELALCIGLAAKALPDTHPKALIQALTDSLGLPLTHDKIASLTLKSYNKILGPGNTATSLEQSLKLLKYGGQYTQMSAANNIQIYRKGDMPHSIRMAVASEDGIHVDGKFSTCKSFYIFQVSAEEYRLIAIRGAETDKPMKSEQKQFYRAEILQDCQVLYSQTISGPAAAKVIKQGGHPITLSANALIVDIIEQLQYVLMTSPPPWLARRMGVEPAIPGYSLEESMK